MTIIFYSMNEVPQMTVKQMKNGLLRWTVRVVAESKATGNHEIWNIKSKDKMYVSDVQEFVNKSIEEFIQKHGELSGLTWFAAGK